MGSALILSEEEKQKYLRLIHVKELEIAEIERKQKEIEEDERVYRAKIRKYEEENKIYFLGEPGKSYLGRYGKWELNPLQKKLIQAFKNPDFNVFTYTGGNRIGKTFISFILIYSCLTGKFPWERDEGSDGWLWKLLGWKPPIKIRWIGEDWEKHVKTVIIPQIMSLWPKSHLMESRKNGLGVEAFFTEKKYGGTIEIMTNKQEPSLFEGWFGHLLVWDEPPKRDNWIASARGLVDFCGREIFAMSLLKEPWVKQEIIDAVDKDGNPKTNIFNIEGTMYDNEGYGTTAKGIEEFKDKMTPAEIRARVDGVPPFEQDKILPIKRNIHFIKRFEIPANWIVDVGIDIGIAKGHDILFRAVSPRGFYYSCFELYVEGDGTQIALSIVSIIHKFNLRVNRIICDPLAKSDRNEENTTYAKIEMILNQYGYFLEVGSKDKEAGILLLRNNLDNKFGEPVEYFFSDLVRTTRQVESWMYDKYGVPKKYRTNELPGDDQCENLYRLALLETQYEDLRVNFDNEFYSKAKNKNRDPITGY